MNTTFPSTTNDPLTNEIPSQGTLRPTIAAASGLYLFTLLLVAIGGTAIQMISIPWGLIATEILLIFLPAYLYLRIRKLPVAETVRWRWPGWKSAVLTIFIGLSLFQFVSWLATILFSVMHYSEDIYAGMEPDNLVNGIIMFIGMAILAPLCEEFLFRGVIQRGYERRGIGFAIGLVAVMFAFYHLSFLRFLGILPFALVICWMYWRSDSLITSVLLHFSYNVVAPIVMLINLIWPDVPLDWMGSLPVALVGLGISAALLVVFWRITPSPAPVEERSPFGLKQALPLIPAALIILVLAAAEMYVALNPDLLVTTPLKLTAPDWSKPVTWQYEIRNRADEAVGQATCQRSLKESAYQLECLFDHQKAYEYQQGNSYYKDSVHQEQILARWDTSNLDILTWSRNLHGDGFQVMADVNRSDLALNVVADGTPEAPLTLAADTILPGEWPWRLAALAFEDGLAYKVTLATPLKWSQEQERSIPQSEAMALRVVGKETVSTPAGEFETWKVTLGSETAWYSLDAPHTLVQYDNGMSVYVMVPGSTAKSR
jgi:membrane protease YdiL (CAAX protease family)